MMSLVLAGCEGDDGDDGAAGAPGASAYEIAVDNGFDGTEEEWLASMQPIHTEESCNVCHGDGSNLDYNVIHPEPLEKPVVTDIVVESGVEGDPDCVTFNVFEEDGVTPVSGLTSGDFRFYMADMLPAGVATTTTFVETADPVTTWETAQLARWMYERDSSSYPFGDFSEDADGIYVYCFDADLAAGGESTIDMNDPEETVIAAPDFDLDHTQRLLIRVDARDLGYNRTIGLLDFVIPADGESTTESGITRDIVAMDACTQCHNDPLQEAAHGGGYQEVAACNICHTPIGNSYGDEMQHIEAWSASLFHKIHASIDMAAFPDRMAIDRNGDGEITPDEEFGYSVVKYPKNINDCEACHADDGQDLADAWLTPTNEGCGTCHGVVHNGTAVNGSCGICHDDGAAPSVTTAHEIVDPATYFTTITLEADADGDGVYEAGETPLITVTVEDADGNPISALDPNITRANLYVYGPRSKPVPVLKPGSSTDPAYDPADGPPTQGSSMLVNPDDPQVETDADGFKYRLLAIPEGMEAGTYMIQAYVTDLTRTPEENRYRTSVSQFGWTYDTFQIGSATETLAISGDCFSCHQENDWGTMYHRSYFGADGCVACHDLSGNHANFLGNRVHAVHAASQNGDLLGAAWDGSDTENPDHYVLFPQDIASCDACHTSGNDQYREDPNMYAPNCYGCHGDTEGLRDHLIQSGAGVFSAH
jgi:hypothetical protein